MVSVRKPKVDQDVLSQLNKPKLEIFHRHEKLRSILETFLTGASC